MSGNDESPIIYFGDSLQLTNWILDSGAMCHMTLQTSDFIPGLFKYTDKYIEVTDGRYFTAKKEVQFQIKMCDDNRNNFIATLHKVLMSPDLCDKLFLIIMFPQTSDFIPVLFKYMDKYIEVTDGHYFTAKQEVQFQIKMCDDNRNNFIATLHKVLMSPDLCDKLFLIIMLMNLGHTCLFHKGFRSV